MSPLEATLDVEGARPACDLAALALLQWPSLDPDAMARLDCDRDLVAAYVAARTDLAPTTVLSLLDARETGEDVWFG